MELIPFTPMLPKRIPTIRITKRGFILSREAVEQLKLTTNDRVVFYHMPVDITDIYIRKSEGIEGLPCIKKRHTIHINDRGFARRILGALRVDNALYRLGQEEAIGHVLATSIITRINYASTTEKRTQI
jgi:hypothetical protein